MVHDEKHHIPFSIRASAFAARLRSKSKSRRKPDVLTTNELTNHELGYVSLSRRSFFQRTVRKSDAGLHPDQPVVQTPTDDGHVSTNPKSLFRRKARSAAEPPNAQKEFPMVPDPILKASPAAPTSDAAPQASSSKALPHVQIASDLDDDDWEEVEARPQSPLYALRNKGINPAPAVLTKKKHSGIPAKPSEDAERTKPHHHRLSFSLPRSIFLPSPSKRRKTTSHPVSPSPASRPRPNRRQLSVRTKALEPRGVSISLPSSPFLLVTSHDTSGEPNTLSTSVVVSPLNAPSPPPVFPVSVSKTRRMSMGYHNQFFPDTPSKSAHPKSASYPSLPQAITSQQGRQFPFPRMQVCNHPSFTLCIDMSPQ